MGEGRQPIISSGPRAIEGLVLGRTHGGLIGPGPPIVGHKT